MGILMETISWLLNLCVKHIKQYKDAIKTQSNSRAKKKLDDANFELKFHADFVEKSEGRPSDLANLSSLSILVLSYFTKLTVGGDLNVKGYEILEKLQNDNTDNSDTYLAAYDELERMGWLSLFNDKDNIFQIRPYVWLQTKLEFGDTFHKIEGSILGNKRDFISNDEFLEKMFEYLNNY